MPPAVVNEEMVHLIEDLYRDEWFTPRVSSCYLIPKTYAKISEIKDEASLKILRDCFFDLCKDDTPMARRAAAKNLSAFFAVVDDSCLSLFTAQYEDFINSEDVRELLFLFYVIVVLLVSLMSLMSLMSLLFR